MGAKEVVLIVQVIFLALSAWTEITHTYYDGLFFHHISLKILAISKDMPVLFASSGKKIVFVKYGTYFCPSTYLVLKKGGTESTIPPFL
jgi:hypothetical protein